MVPRMGRLVVAHFDVPSDCSRQIEHSDVEGIHNGEQRHGQGFKRRMLLMFNQSETVQQHTLTIGHTPVAQASCSSDRLLGRGGN
jgi:hypothetical protein